MSRRAAEVYVELALVPLAWPKRAERKKIIVGEGGDFALCSRSVPKVSSPPGHLSLSILLLFEIFIKDLKSLFSNRRVRGPTMASSR